ncbi:MAG TPA: hypothetical protein PLX89_17075 [Verrucomicrobiota bacterium]|nr:hypothetical protein [Verrucomicrobiales bacterium]HRI14710.1 hypothetical protein [Verrucomicrobiota bacterium]
MKTQLSSFLLVALLGVAAHSRLPAQSTTLTYQGRLTSDGNPANGSYDFQFTLFDTESEGNPVGYPMVAAAVEVAQGLFTVPLDFGANVFSGQDRWLGIAVRRAGTDEFTPLSPRQPITATPYALTALTALNVPGVNGHALHALNGSVANALFVDVGGRVGIGTTNPASKLHLVSSANENIPPRAQSSGASGFAAGWDFYHGSTGKGYVGVPDPGASIAPNEMLLYGGPGIKASLWAGGARALTATPNRVGIGTTVPKASLDVRGDILLGSNGELDALGSPERLRIIRGRVGRKGQIVSGSGFQVAPHDGRFPYTVTFTPPFAAPPVVMGTVAEHAYLVVRDVTAEMARINLIMESTVLIEEDFQFIAIGPR